ncbi:MAG TPA: DUF6036 family nucleotidyltransferase [Pyrinomonadaceae bacterium]|nr:DUF6036 family nucleotidyltransferase [Pyrinomonadaceae bacterium]
MRQKVTAQRLHDFIKALGGAATTPVRIFLVGGATAVLLGWRDSTIDVDMKVVPDSDSILKSLPALKERLEMNIELASPDDFIPALRGWQERSRFIQQEGKIGFFHYDFYAQALAKIERGHDTDMLDVQEMILRGLIEPKRLLVLFSSIENQLYRYPAIDGASFRRAVEHKACGS